MTATYEGGSTCNHDDDDDDCHDDDDDNDAQSDDNDDAHNWPTGNNVLILAIKDQL